MSEQPGNLLFDSPVWAAHEVARTMYPTGGGRPDADAMADRGRIIVDGPLAIYAAERVLRDAVMRAAPDEAATYASDGRIEMGRYLQEAARQSRQAQGDTHA